jgi:hypothetical protein
MATNILAIQPRYVKFRTQTNTDWLDGLVIWQAGQGGIVAGAANTGNGALTIQSVAPQATLGAHIVAITSLDGIPRVTVTDPAGTVTGRGVVGTAFYAGGITLTLSAGSTAFAVDDTFAVTVLPVPVDITGLRFDLQARLTSLSANVALSASSSVPAGAAAPTTGTPTIVLGTTGGQVAMAVLRNALARSVFAPGVYVYDLVATDPVANLTVPAFYGQITHVDGVTFLPQGG